MALQGVDLLLQCISLSDCCLICSACGRSISCCRLMVTRNSRSDSSSTGMAPAAASDGRHNKRQVAAKISNISLPSRPG